MKLKIVGEPVAVCKIDMVRLKSEFKKSLDLMGSIRDSFVVEKKGCLPEESLLKYACYGLDWMRILTLKNRDNKEDMVIRYFEVEYEDMVEYSPHLISEDGREIELKQKIKKGVDVMMVNSFVASPNFDLKCYLDMTLFEYGKDSWKLLVR